MYLVKRNHGPCKVALASSISAFQISPRCAEVSSCSVLQAAQPGLSPAQVLVSFGSEKHPGEIHSSQFFKVSIVQRGPGCRFSRAVSFLFPLWGDRRNVLWWAIAVDLAMSFISWSYGNYYFSSEHSHRRAWLKRKGLQICSVSSAAIFAEAVSAPFTHNYA